ncbi:MAG: hypothetical protein QM484_13435 [Woeseiaceae bacterium]
MSFLSTTFPVPFWFLIFTFACAAPLWIRWYKFIYKKAFKSGLLKKKFADVTDSVEDVSILQKATDNWNTSAEFDRKSKVLKKSKQQHDINSVEQPYVKIVLKTLALNGDAGMLIQSIADKLNIKSNEIKSTLVYLEENNFVEAVVGSMGAKYYLDSRGIKYCIKRGYVKAQ